MQGWIAQMTASRACICTADRHCQSPLNLSGFLAHALKRGNLLEMRNLSEMPHIRCPRMALVFRGWSMARRKECYNTFGYKMQYSSTRGCKNPSGMTQSMYEVGSSVGCIHSLDQARFSIAFWPPDYLAARLASSHM